LLQTNFRLQGEKKFFFFLFRGIIELVGTGGGGEGEKMKAYIEGEELATSTK
jgi:hypothetical protein